MSNEVDPRTRDSDQPLPKHIGPYTVLGKIGSGGMGVVYRVQQPSPRRDVALKVIQGEHVTARMLKRFELERAALARLHHPGIARIYDSGTHDGHDGPEPFLTMELVRGRPITEYARNQHLSVTARLTLFVKLCSAVTHAHRYAVIHRDLKPENILCDEQGEPKVLDFGLAKLLDEDSGAGAKLTVTHQFVGTWAYASPEQSRGDPIDTRTDIYALGVIAYELLSQRLPHALEGRDRRERERVVCEDSPLPLEIGGRRCNRDLETIVLKALAKEPDRRYGTVAELAADVERFLRTEPILARPASLSYRARLFVRRKRALASGILVACAALLLSAGVALRSFRGVVRAEQRATLNLDLAQDLLARFLSSSRLDDVVVDLETGQRVIGQAEQLWGLQDPRTLSAVENVANALHQRASWKEAEPLHRRVLVWRRENLGDGHPDTLGSMTNLANVLMDKGVIDEPEALLAEVVRIRRDTLGDEDPSTLLARYASTSFRLGQGYYEEAVTELNQILEACAESVATDGPDVRTVKGTLAYALCFSGRLEDANELASRTWDDHVRAQTEATDDAASVRFIGGYTLAQLGSTEDALDALHEALWIQKALLGPNNLRTILTETTIAAIEARTGSYEAGVTRLAGLVSRQETLVGPDHPDTIRMLQELAAVTWAHEKGPGAVALFEEVLCRRESAEQEGAEYLRVQASSNLAAVFFETGRYDEADALLTRASVSPFTLTNPDDSIVLDLQCNLAEVLAQRGELEAARGILENIVIRCLELGPRADEDALAYYRTQLGIILRNLGDCRNAADLFEESLAYHEAVDPQGATTIELTHELEACNDEAENGDSE